MRYRPASQNGHEAPQRSPPNTQGRKSSHRSHYRPRYRVSIQSRCTAAAVRLMAAAVCNHGDYPEKRLMSAAAGCLQRRQELGADQLGDGDRAADVTYCVLHVGRRLLAVVELLT